MIKIAQKNNVRLHPCSYITLCLPDYPLCGIQSFITVFKGDECAVRDCLSPSLIQDGAMFAYVMTSNRFLQGQNAAVTCTSFFLSPNSTSSLLCLPPTNLLLSQPCTFLYLKQLPLIPQPQLQILATKYILQFPPIARFVLLHLLHTPAILELSSSLN